MVKQSEKVVTRPRLIKTSAYGLVSVLMFLGMGSVSADSVVASTVSGDSGVSGEVIETDFVEVELGDIESKQAEVSTVKEDLKVSEDAILAGESFSGSTHPISIGSEVVGSKEVEETPAEGVVTDLHVVPVKEEPKYINATELDKPEDIKSDVAPAKETGAVVNASTFNTNVENHEKDSAIEIENGVTELKADRPASKELTVKVNYDKGVTVNTKLTAEEAEKLGFTAKFTEDGVVYVAGKDLLDKVNATVNIPQTTTGSVTFESLVSLKREIADKDVETNQVGYEPVTKTRDVMKVQVVDGVEKLVKVTETYTEYEEVDASYTIKHYTEGVSEFFEPVTVTLNSSDASGTFGKLTLVSPSGVVSELVAEGSKVTFTPTEKGTHRIDYVVNSTGERKVDFTVSVSGASSTGEFVSGEVIGTHIVKRTVIEPVLITKTRDVLKEVERTRMVGVAEEFDADVTKVRLVDKTEEYTETVLGTVMVDEVETYEEDETRVRMVETEVTEKVPRMVTKTREVTEQAYEEKIVGYEDKEVSETIKVKKFRDVPVTTTTTNTNLKETSLGISYILDKSASRAAIYTKAHESVDRFFKSLDESKVNATLQIYGRGGDTFISDQLLKASNISTNKDTKLIVIESDFIDFPGYGLFQNDPDFKAHIAKYGTFSEDVMRELTATGLAFAIAAKKGNYKIPEGYKVLLIQDQFDVGPFKVVRNEPNSAELLKKFEEMGAYVSDDEVHDLGGGFYVARSAAGLSAMDVFDENLDRSFILDKFLEKVATTTTTTNTTTTREEYEVEEVVTRIEKVPIIERVPLFDTVTKKVSTPEEYIERVTKTRTIKVPKQTVDLIKKARTIKVPELYTVKERQVRVLEVPETYKEQVLEKEEYQVTEYRLVERDFKVELRGISKEATVNLKKATKFEDVTVKNPSLFVDKFEKAGHTYSFITTTNIGDLKGFGHSASKAVSVTTKEDPVKEEPKQVVTPAEVKVAPVEVALPAVIESPKLPETGDSSSVLALVGGVLSLVGAGVVSRNREKE